MSLNRKSKKKKGSITESTATTDKVVLFSANISEHGHGTGLMMS